MLSCPWTSLHVGEALKAVLAFLSPFGAGLALWKQQKGVEAALRLG